jgi:hypothetical protein
MPTNLSSLCWIGNMCHQSAVQITVSALILSQQLWQPQRLPLIVSSVGQDELFRIKLGRPRT